MTDNLRGLPRHDHEREEAASPERQPFRLHAGTLFLYYIGLTIPFLYILHLIPVRGWPISPAGLANAIPITRNRIEFLGTLNTYYPHSYMVTFLGSLFASVFLSIAMMASYRRLVLVDRTRYPVTQDPTMPGMIKGIAMGVAFFSTCMWICFIWVPWGYDIRYPGTAVLLFWPAFPFLAAGTTGMFAAALTTLVIVLFEIMSRSRRK